MSSSSSSIVTCLAWIRRGEANSLTNISNQNLKESDLKDLYGKLPENLEEDVKSWSSDSDDTSEEDVPIKKRKNDIKKIKKPVSSEPLDEDLEVLEEYNLEDYDSDQKDGAYTTEFASMSVFSSNKEDPYMTNYRDEEDEREEEDFQLKPDDNLILIGRTEEDGAILEVYVFNEKEDSLYVHHDVLLPSFPLALEPVKPTIEANYVAMGYFTPNIDIWDLDVVNSLEPVFSLGEKKMTKKSKAKSVNSHTDAVLDLSWNHNVSNVLASASADKTVALWDMESKKMVSRLTQHSDKVQSVEWHPFEGQCLLTGGCDGLVTAVDCQDPRAPVKSWQVEGEVEKIIWNHFQPYQFFVSNDKGTVQGFDMRSKKHLFMLKAHEDAITCMSMSHYVEGAIATVSADQTCKLWHIQDNKPSLLLTKEPKMGIIHCSAFSPDSPGILALGGARDSLRTIDFTKSCANVFKKREHFASKVLKSSKAANNTNG